MQLVLTTSKINEAKAKGLKALGVVSYKQVLEKNYSIDICNENSLKMYQIWIAVKLLYTWKQSLNGNTINEVNYLTLEQLNAIVSWVNKECN